MQVGYFAVGIGPTVDPEWVRTVATTAERLGFSTIWAPEHVVLLEQYASKYPYSSGDFPAPTDTPIVRGHARPVKNEAPARPEPTGKAHRGHRHRRGRGQARSAPGRFGKR